jgi:hypothetical protein
LFLDLGAIKRKKIMIPANILNALKKLYQVINGKNIPWILSGSTHSYPFKRFQFTNFARKK